MYWYCTDLPQNKPWCRWCRTWWARLHRSGGIVQQENYSPTPMRHTKSPPHETRNDRRKTLQDDDRKHAIVVESHTFTHVLVVYMLVVLPSFSICVMYLRSVTLFFQLYFFNIRQTLETTATRHSWTCSSGRCISTRYRTCTPAGLAEQVVNIRPRHSTKNVARLTSSHRVYPQPSRPNLFVATSSQIWKKMKPD